MKAYQAHQTVNQALIVLRQAFLDEAQVAINSDSNLVYVNPARRDPAPFKIPDPVAVREILAAKIEHELAPFHNSMDALRLHIKQELPSLNEVGVKEDDQVIPSLLHEWEEMLKQIDPAGSANFAKDKRIMARRETLVKFLCSCLPASGTLTPLDGQRYEALLTSSPEQMQMVLDSYQNNGNRSIDPELNITNQLIKDSHRQDDLHVLIPTEIGARRGATQLKFATKEATADALRTLTAERHRRSDTAALASENAPKDRSDLADKNFMQVLSMMSDQTLRNQLDDLKAMMMGNGAVIFETSRLNSSRHLLIDAAGNAVVTVREEHNAKSLYATAFFVDPIALEATSSDTSLHEAKPTMSFNAAVMVEKADAEQGLLRPRFIGRPELAISFSIDWKKMDQLLARKWP